jgi:hypothetical protein
MKFTTILTIRKRAVTIVVSSLSSAYIELVSLLCSTDRAPIDLWNMFEKLDLNSLYKTKIQRGLFSFCNKCLIKQTHLEHCSSTGTAANFLQAQVGATHFITREWSPRPRKNGRRNRKT